MPSNKGKTTYLNGLGVQPGAKRMMRQVEERQSNTPTYNPAQQQPDFLLSNASPSFSLNPMFEVQQATNNLMDIVRNTQSKNSPYVPFAPGTKTAGKRLEEAQQLRDATSRSSFGSLPGSNAGDNVKGWLEEAVQISGVPRSWMPALEIIAMKESSGNPKAINDWDSNAKAGRASRGLMQTTPSTFDAYKLPGYDDIYDPVSNAVAAIRYIQDRYGDVWNVPGIQALQSGEKYVGY